MAAKKSSSKSTASDTSNKKAPSKKKASKKASAAGPSKDRVSAMDVTLGHIFSLKPRVDRSFRQSDVSQAKRNLADETYADLPEAARAVAEEALDITRAAAQRPNMQRR